MPLRRSWRFIFLEGLDFYSTTDCTRIGVSDTRDMGEDEGRSRFVLAQFGGRLTQGAGEVIFNAHVLKK
jgi:hypothetical protein